VPARSWADRPNGAGKSTTFNLVTGVLRATRGQVLFRGERIEGLASREIARRGVSRTFQHVKMIAGMTVLENVALGAHLRGARGVAAAMLRLDRAEERRPAARGRAPACSASAWPTACTSWPATWHLGRSA
jgi:ABC-type branched-subunit amino acid transport system ATPase component